MPFPLLKEEIINTQLSLRAADKEGKNKKDIAKLADILGHSSINTTRIYIISTGTEHRQRMENMRLVI